MYAVAITASVLFVACNGNKENQSTENSSTTTAPAADSATTAATPAQTPASNTINITGNDQMKYDQTAFTVKSGEPVTLTMKNIGTLPAASMSHDVVILKPGSDINTFGQEVGKVQGNIEKLPADVKALIVAKTKLLGPGESDTITFTLPSAGEYPFLCSFPGHYAAMNGKITAQ